MSVSDLVCAQTFGSWAVQIHKDRLDDRETTVLIARAQRPLDGSPLQFTPLLMIACTQKGVILGIDLGMAVYGPTTPIGLRIDKEPAKREAWENGDSGDILLKRNAESLIFEMIGKTQLYVEVNPRGGRLIRTDFSLIGLSEAIAAARPNCPL